MKHCFWKFFFLATFMLSLAALALAQGQGVCSAAHMAGEYGHTLTGVVYPPNLAPGTAVAFEAVGRVTIDKDGNISGTQHSSLGGAVSQEKLEGTITSNADCTIAWTVGIYDEWGTTLLRTATWAGVVVGNGTGAESRSIMTSLVMPTPGGDVNIPAVVTVIAKKVPGSGDER
jgi:hypothetical protein